MRKLTRLFVIAAALTVIFAVPAMAQEVTDPATIKTEAQLIAELTAHQNAVESQLQVVTSGMADKNAAQQHADAVHSQLRKYNRDEADNYLKYLDRAIINLKETERIKLEVVNNYTNLSAVNSTYAAMVPQAQADYNNAVAARQMWEANRAKAAADFDVMYPR